jgi:hypothetical protein
MLVSRKAFEIVEENIMNIEEAQKVLWLKNYHRSLGVYAVKANALPAHAFGRLQSVSREEELSPALRFGDAHLHCAAHSAAQVSQSASGEELRPLFGRTLMPSVLDRASKGEL